VEEIERMDRKWSGEVGQREKGYGECYRGERQFWKGRS